MSTDLPRFRIATLLWLTALLASAMGTFGPGWGIAATILVVVLHSIWISRTNSLGCLLGAILVAGVLVALLLPAVQSARESARRAYSMNNMRQLALAMHNYHDNQLRFPPHYSTDSEGRQLHSWRTLVLPFIASYRRYSKINRDEPWSSPANSKLLDSLGNDAFRSPREAALGALSNETHYFAIVDEATVWRPGGGVTFRDISDGASNTIVLIEAAGRGVRWYEPRDLTMEEAIDLLTGEVDEKFEWIKTGFYISTRYRSDGMWYRNVAFADGHVESIERIRDRKTARALLTRAGGEEIPENYHDYRYDRELTVIGHIIHWPRVISTTLFIMLSIAPAFRKHSPPDEAPDAE